MDHGPAPGKLQAGRLSRASAHAHPDLSVPPLAEMVNILNTIDSAIVSGRTVYLHCWGGVGRTGTVVGCYLARHGQRGQSALDELTRLWKVMQKATWRVSPETDEQKEFVRNWRE
jgi:protein-tyrosine phosphatase